MSKILKEAEVLVNGARREDYGSVQEDFKRIAAIWSAILGCEVKPEQIPLCMIGVKISREVYKHKDDNMVDIIGYVLTLEKLLNE